jgi:hypothetical protein
MSNIADAALKAILRSDMSYLPWCVRREVYRVAFPSVPRFSRSQALKHDPIVSGSIQQVKMNFQLDAILDHWRRET